MVRPFLQIDLFNVQLRIEKKSAVYNMFGKIERAQVLPSVLSLGALAQWVLLENILKLQEFGACQEISCLNYSLGFLRFDHFTQWVRVKTPGVLHVYLDRIVNYRSCLGFLDVRCYCFGKCGVASPRRDVYFVLSGHLLIENLDLPLYFIPQLLRMEIEQDLDDVLLHFLDRLNLVRVLLDLSS